MTYDPRQYWPSRLARKGPSYVAHLNKTADFDSQASVFWDALSGYLPEGGRFLDFGCGVGRFASILSAEVDQYVGVDLNEKALDHVPDVSNAEFVYLPQDELPFGDDYFDGGMALTVLQHIVAPEAFALWTDEIHRVIKPGGYFLVVETPEPPKHRAPHGPAPHMCWRTAEIIAEALGGRLEKCHLLTAEYADSHYCARINL